MIFGEGITSRNVNPRVSFLILRHGMYHVEIVEFFESSIFQFLQYIRILFFCCNGISIKTTLFDEAIREVLVNISDTFANFASDNRIQIEVLAKQSVEMNLFGEITQAKGDTTVAATNLDVVVHLMKPLEADLEKSKLDSKKQGEAIQEELQSVKNELKKLKEVVLMLQESKK
jgi:hypothetical protein